MTPVDRVREFTVVEKAPYYWYNVDFDPVKDMYVQADLL